MASLTAGLTAFYTFRAYFMTFHGELKVPPEAGSHGHDSGHGDAHDHNVHDHDQGHGHAQGHGHDHAHVQGHGHVHAAATHSVHAVDAGSPGAQGSPGGEGVAHESPPSMTVPLMILAVGALVLGAIVGHATHLFDNYLDKTIVGLAAESKSHATNWVVVGLSQLFAAVGIGLAFVMYGLPSKLPAQLAKTAGGLAHASRNRFYFDELYSMFIVLPLTALAQISRFADWYLVDGLLVGGVSQIPGRLFGRNAQPLQNGLVQFYALTMVLGVAVLMTAILMSPIWQG
jgi:NADH-quinone oxidoreductase subunit L